MDLNQGLMLPAYSKTIFVVLPGILFYNKIPALRLVFAGMMITHSNYLLFNSEAAKT